MNAVIELVPRDRPDAPASLYACGRCGSVYSWRIYACGEEKAREAAISAAADCFSCKERPIEDERESHREHRERRIAKATPVTNLGFCFSDDGGECYPSPEDARDAGETGVFGANFSPYRVDIGSFLESAVEGHHDEASTDDLLGVDDLVAAVDAFNAQQTGGSYNMDDKVWQELRQDRTFAMIKPDATARGVEDAMIADIEAAGFTVLERERNTLTRDQAEWLYREHSSRDHFRDLVDYTISGDVVMLKLQMDDPNAPARFRELMGPTDRTKAPAGTLRATYAVGYRENSIHGSDSPGAAIDELAYFFR